MLAALLITFRETLEASLIVGIVLAHLKKIGQTAYNKLVWAGVFSGIGASVLCAYLFQQFLGGFTGQTEELVEGILMLVGAGLLTTMILWMMKQNKKQQLHQKIDSSISKAQQYELFTLVFIAVLREGIETVIFLSALFVAIGNTSLLGGLIGIPLAALLGYALYKQSLTLNLKKFFTITGVILILFAAGLVAHGVHELQEAHILPTLVEHIWDINPQVIGEDTYPLLHENGIIGSIGKGLFGYNGNPSLLEVISYIIYLVLISFFWKKRTYIHKHS